MMEYIPKHKGLDMDTLIRLDLLSAYYALNYDYVFYWFIALGIGSMISILLSSRRG